MEMLRERVAQQQRQAGFSLFIWTPYTGTFEHNYIMGITSNDLIAMADGTTNYISSGNATLMGPCFQALNESCDTSIVMAERIKTGAIGNTGDRMPDAVVETFACKVNPGSTMADVTAAVDFWKTAVAKMPSPNSYEATMLRPYRGTNGDVDFGWVGASPDLKSWARGDTDYLASKDGQAGKACFAKVSTCRISLWTGYWIVPPAAQ
jgi:hypothetical protein